MFTNQLKSFASYYKLPFHKFEQLGVVLDKNAYEQMRTKALNSKNIKECVDIFEKFYQDKVVEKQKDTMRTIIDGLSRTGAIIAMVPLPLLLLEVNPIIVPAISAIGFIMATVALCMSYKMRSEARAQQEVEIYQQETPLADICSSCAADEVKNRAKVSKINYLLDILENKFPQMTIDRQKIGHYLIHNYSDYYWNKIIDYCVSNCEDANSNPSYDNFIKLTQISAKVYRMFSDLFFPENQMYDFKTQTGAIYSKFKEYCQYKLSDYIPINDLKNKNGLINDAKVNKLFEIYQRGPHGLVTAFASARNANGEIAWDSIDTIRKTNVIVRDALYNEKIKGGDSLVNEILYEIVENNYNQEGNIQPDKLKEFNKSLKTEIEMNGLKNNSLLRNILSPELLCKIGVNDKISTSVKEAANSDSKLYDLYRNQNLSILDFLKNVQASSADVYNFLCKMTTENETQKQLAKEFSANPRMSKSIHTFLLKKLGNDKKAHELFNSWYYDEKYGYRKAYERYYNEDIWANAQYFMDLVKQSPNVSTWALKCFCKEKNTEPILGVLPEYIGTRKDFTNLINELKIWHKNACKLKEKTKNKTVFDIPFEININNKTYNMKCLTRGHSPKLKFIFTINNNPEETYVIKFAPYDAIGNTDRSNKFRENQAIRPDMPYVDSMVDFYLKLNNCPNAADILYFDYNVQASLYKATKGEHPVFTEEFECNIHNFRNYKPSADIYKLGVELNDIYHTNFIVDENGICKAIDTGHAKYNNIFRPLVIGKNIALANMCGREL